MFRPDSIQGAEAWQAYSEEYSELEPLSTEVVDCLPWGRHADKDFVPGDRVCIGYDEDAYIWECRKVSDLDWCNLHYPQSKYGFLAWKLLAGVPNIVDPDAVEGSKSSAVDDAPKEWTDEQLFALMDKYPLQEGWTRYMRDVILPLTIDQVWDCFFADDAPYFIDQQISDLGDKLRGTSDWHEVTDPRYMESVGMPVLQKREIKSDCKVPPNPFVDHGNSTKNLMLVKRDDIEMIFGEVNAQNGMIYADSFEIWTKWEIYAPFPGSQKTILGHSYKLIWLNKPWAVSGILESVAEGKIEEALDFDYTWYIDRAASYVEMLEEREMEEEEYDEGGLDLHFTGSSKVLGSSQFAPNTETAR